MSKSKELSPITYITQIKDWDKISDDTAKLFMDEAKEFLGSTMDVYDSTTKRADRLIVLTISLLIAAFGYLENVLSKGVFPDKMLWVTIACVGLLLFALVALGLTYLPKTISSPGTPPEGLIVEDTLQGKVGEKQLKFVMLYLSESYQDRISGNNRVNNKRTSLIQKACYALACTPILALIGLLIKYSFVLKYLS